MPDRVTGVGGLGGGSTKQSRQPGAATLGVARRYRSIENGQLIWDSLRISSAGACAEGIAAILKKDTAAARILGNQR